MIALDLRENCLGFEIHDGDHLVALYRTREELPRFESPKPCSQWTSSVRPGADVPSHAGVFWCRLFCCAERQRRS